jgi:hypothetical protein
MPTAAAAGNMIAASTVLTRKISYYFTSFDLTQAVNCSGVHEYIHNNAARHAIGE